MEILQEFLRKTVTAASGICAVVRKGKGPSLVECLTYRIRPHNEGSEEIRPRQEIERWKKKDPVLLFRRRLMAKGILTESAVKKIAEEVSAELEEEPYGSQRKVQLLSLRRRLRTFLSETRG